MTSDTTRVSKVWSNLDRGQHYWYTGKKGNELDLAGLVCNKHGDETCINPCVGMEGGVTWEERMVTLGRLEDESSDG